MPHFDILPGVSGPYSRAFPRVQEPKWDTAWEYGLMNGTSHLWNIGVLAGIPRLRLTA